MKQHVAMKVNFHGYTCFLPQGVRLPYLLDESAGLSKGQASFVYEFGLTFGQSRNKGCE